VTRTRNILQKKKPNSIVKSGSTIHTRDAMLSVEQLLEPVLMRQRNITAIILLELMTTN